MPSLRRTPLPRTRNVRPFGRALRQPQGHRRAPERRHLDLRAERQLRERHRHGHRQVVARAAEHRVRLDVHRTYRSPAGPPRSPGAPLPLSRIRWPSATPAGIRAWMVRVPIARPLPWQAGQGSSTTRPRPRHSRHGSGNAERAEVPGRLPGALAVRAHPRHGAGLGAGAVAGRAGALAGEPERHRAPSIASPNVSVTSVSTSAPRRAAARGRAVPAAAAEQAAEHVAQAAAAAAPGRRTGHRGRSRRRRRGPAGAGGTAEAAGRTASAPRRTPCAASRRTGRVGLGDLLEPLLGRGVALVASGWYLRASLR